ncbi:MAG: CoA-binding protein [Clostridia bacterium]|nr:CoA-binding protein [Clostridia bacterium]
MQKLGKEFFINNEVLFVGYSSRDIRLSKEIFNAFTNKGIKVYPLNRKENVRFDIKVYKRPAELPKIPKCAYLLINADNAEAIIQQLAENGVRRILFHSSKTVHPSTLDQCRKMGIETAVACPMMTLGSGLHRIHGFFSGVR